jgi:hypothetical protein
MEKKRENRYPTMRIPSASISVSAPNGQTGSALHPQFGTVSVVADRQLDDSFKSLDGPPVEQWYGPENPTILGLMKFGAQEIQKSAALAIQISEYGLEENVDIQSAVRSHAYEQLQQVAKDGHLPGYVNVKVQPSGQISEVSFLLSEDFAQKVCVTNSKASLESYRTDATHAFEFDLSQGEPELSTGRETLTMKTPWLKGGSLSDLSPEAISSIEDPRLERLAQAAEAGFMIASEELGPNWKSTLQEGHQILTLGSESIDLDRQGHSFTLSASSWHTGHAGSSGCSTDYQVSDSIRWHDGRIDRCASNQI